MRFERPGLSSGPTDTDLQRLERHRLIIRAAGGPEDVQAAILDLSVEECRRLRNALIALQ